MVNREKEKIFVFGASGHAKVVIDVIEKEGRYAVAFLVDDNVALKDTSCYGYRVVGGKEELLAISGPRAGIVAVGSNAAREAISAWLHAHGFTLVSTVHPSAQLGRGVAVGPGSVIMAGAIINSDAVIGSNVIVNTRASIDHDCTVGDAVHIAPGCTLCGTVAVGAGSFICAGSIIIPNIVIGKRVTVGAGSTVIRDVVDDMTVVGAPARKLNEKRG